MNYIYASQKCQVYAQVRNSTKASFSNSISQRGPKTNSIFLHICHIAVFIAQILPSLVSFYIYWFLKNFTWLRFEDTVTRNMKNVKLEMHNKNSSWLEKARNRDGRIHDQTKVKTAIISPTDRYNDDHGDVYEDYYKHRIQDSLYFILLVALF